MFRQINRALAALAALGLVAGIAYAAIILSELALKPDRDTTFVYVKSFPPQNRNRTDGRSQHR